MLWARGFFGLPTPPDGKFRSIDSFFHQAQKIPLSGVYNEACRARKKKKTTTDSGGPTPTDFVHKMSVRVVVAERIGVDLRLI